MPRATPAACSPLWIGEVSDASLWTHKPRSHTLWTGVGPRKDGQEFTWGTLRGLPAGVGSASGAA